MAGDVTQSTTLAEIVTHTENVSQVAAIPINNFTQIAVPILLGIACVVGVFGNLTVIVVIFLTKKLRTITNIYLLNLAIADLLFVLNLPIWIVTYSQGMEWIFGTVMCKLARMLVKQNMFASVLLLTALSIDRALAVVFAQSRTRNITHRFEHLKFTWPITTECTSLNTTIITIWIISMLLSLPEFVISTVSTHPLYKVQMCKFALPADSKEQYFRYMGLYELYLFMTSYVIPLLILVVCYSLIVTTVRQKLLGSSEKKQRAIKIAASVVATFFLCFLPVQLLRLHSILFGWFKVFEPMKMTEDHKLVWHNVNTFAVVMAFSNSTINPVIYAFSVSSFQKSFYELIGRAPPTNRTGVLQPANNILKPRPPSRQKCNIPKPQRVSQNSSSSLDIAYAVKAPSMSSSSSWRGSLGRLRRTIAKNVSLLDRVAPGRQKEHQHDLSSTLTGDNSYDLDCAMLNSSDSGASAGRGRVRTEWRARPAMLSEGETSGISQDSNATQTTFLGSKRSKRPSFASKEPMSTDDGLVDVFHNSSVDHSNDQ